LERWTDKAISHWYV